jgi:hypothetical protein
LARRSFVASVLLVLIAAAPVGVAAQDAAAPPVEAGVPAVLTPLAPSSSSETGGATTSTILLRSLYVTTLSVQGLDAESSLEAFRLGAVEQNPLMRPFVSSRPAFFAVKAGIAAATILVAHNTAKHNRVKAIVELVAINAAYGFYISHNYSVIKQMRAQQGH